MTEALRKWVYCWDTPEFKCCGSCHHDWEEGFDGADETEIGDDTLAVGCCGFGDFMKKAAQAGEDSREG